MLAKQVSFGIYNGLLPSRNGEYTSPLAMPVTLAFTTKNEQTLDFLKEYQGADIEFIQSVYIDNWDNADYLELLVPVTLYRLKARPASQGWYPLILPKNVPIVVSTTPPGAEADPLAVTLIFANVPFPAQTW